MYLIIKSQQHVCLSVCLCVCLRTKSRISRNPKTANFSVNIVQIRSTFETFVTDTSATLCITILWVCSPNLPSLALEVIFDIPINKVGLHHDQIRIRSIMHPPCSPYYDTCDIPQIYRSHRRSSPDTKSSSPRRTAWLRV